MEKVKENFGVIEGVGSRLRQWRNSKNLKGYELAEMIHISQGSLSEIENNKTLPSAETLTKLHKYCKINIVWLLTNNGPSEYSLSSNTKTDILEFDTKLSHLINKLIKIFKGKDNVRKLRITRLLNNADD